MFTIFEYHNLDETIKEKIEVYDIRDEPWFKGKQIAKILGYKDTKDAIQRHVDTDDKFDAKSLNLTSSEGEGKIPLLIKYDPQTIFINESGLYSLIISSKLPLAKEFKRWITKEVLPSIRKTSRYDIKQTDTDKLPKLFIDINNYLNKSCLYILQVINNLYKFGITDDIKRRLSEHKRELKFTDIIKIYELNNFSICKEIENKIKTLVSQLKINKKQDNSIEFFETNNEITLEYILSFINKYIDEENTKTNEPFELQKYKLDIEKLKLEVENKKLDLEKIKIEYELKGRQISNNTKIVNNKLINLNDDNINDSIFHTTNDISNEQSKCIICGTVASNCDKCNKSQVKQHKYNIDNTIDKISVVNNKTESKNDINALKSKDNEIKSTSDIKISKSKDNKTNKQNMINNQNKQIRCPNCGMFLSSTSFNCNRCNKLNKLGIAPVKKDKPSYEQLKKEIDTMPYVWLGRKYGVSDNCIRKWIKNYEKNL